MEGELGEGFLALDEDCSSSESGSLLLEADLELLPTCWSTLVLVLSITPLMISSARDLAFSLRGGGMDSMSLFRSAKGWRPFLTSNLPSALMKKSLSLTVLESWSMRRSVLEDQVCSSWERRSLVSVTKRLLVRLRARLLSSS